MDNEKEIIKDGVLNAPSPENLSGENARHTLPKKEKVCGKKDISRLLSSGKYIVSPAIRCCFLAENSLPYCRIMVSVGKKSFKRAVKRNLLKRRIREAYRLNKHLLPEGKGADMLFIYVPKEVISSEEITASMCEILSAASKRLSTL